MKFIFLTPIRIAPKHWVTWRQHMSDLFSQTTPIKGFTCHREPREEFLIGAHVSEEAKTKNMGQVLASLKAQDLYSMILPPLGMHAENSANLVILKTGEVCRVDVVELTAEEALENHAKIVSDIKGAHLDYAEEIDDFVPIALKKSFLIDPVRTAIHTLIAYDYSDAEQRSVVGEFFKREGLTLPHDVDADTPFHPGWSYSSLNSMVPREVGLFSAVVMRLQCVWYQQRGQRDYCIEQTALLAKQGTVETDISSSHEVIKRLFDFTLWEHELREFSANLKPWLKKSFDALYGFWDMAEESAYIERTLRHSHELLASSYQSRILIQERQQSRLLFVIAAVGLLSIAGSLMSIWTALTWGSIVTESYWATDTGRIIMGGLILANFVAVGIVLYRFVRTQFR